MVKTISFDQMAIENVVIFKQEGQWKVGVNFSLLSGTDGNLGRNVIIQLDKAQQLTLRKFLRPFIQIARDAMDIQNVTNFEDPPTEEEMVAPEEVVTTPEEVVDVIAPPE